MILRERKREVDDSDDKEGHEGGERGGDKKRGEVEGDMVCGR
jgi:hypothetical protein